MKNKKLSKIAVLITLISLLLLPAGSAYAETSDENIETRTITGCRYSFTASSSVSADAYVYAVSSGIASYITSKITLQSAPLGSSSFTNVSGVSPSTYTVYDTASITHLCSFPITSSKDYRIKIELTDEVNGKEVTWTKYKELSR